MLGTLPWEAKRKWQSWVSTMTHAYNCSVSQVTEFSPYFLMFGRKPWIPVDKEFGITFPKDQDPRKYTDYVERLQQKLQWAYGVAQEHIQKDATHC